jgi:hypothetical protein
MLADGTSEGSSCVGDESLRGATCPHLPPSAQRSPERREPALPQTSVNIVFNVRLGLPRCRSRLCLHRPRRPSRPVPSGFITQIPLVPLRPLWKTILPFDADAGIAPARKASVAMQLSVIFCEFISIPLYSVPHGRALACGGLQPAFRDDPPVLVLLRPAEKKRMADSGEFLPIPHDRAALDGIKFQRR